MPDDQKMFPLPPLAPLTKREAAILEVLTEYALKGAPCPGPKELRSLHDLPANDSLKRMALKGYIRIQFYGKNWRVVEITYGEHAGAKTMASPFSKEPWQVLERCEQGLEDYTRHHSAVKHPKTDGMRHENLPTLTHCVRFQCARAAEDGTPPRLVEKEDGTFQCPACLAPYGFKGPKARHLKVGR